MAMASYVQMAQCGRYGDISFVLSMSFRSSGEALASIYTDQQIR